jgi:hypothetical protein
LSITPTIGNIGGLVLRNRCALCGNQQEIQLFHNNYICANCISYLKNSMKQELFDASVLRDNQEELLSQASYSVLEKVSQDVLKKKK